MLGPRQHRFNQRAVFLCLAAARAKPAATRGGERRRWIAFEQGTSPWCAVEGKLRDRGKQCAHVRMPGIGANLLNGAAFDNLAQEHHNDSRAKLANDPQVVADEHQREIESLLEVSHQVGDLRLDREIERCDRFVGDDQRRPQDDRTGNADALTLSA